MKLSTLPLFAVTAQALPHYVFPQIASSTAWQYVRKTAELKEWNPVTNVTSPDIRCHQETPGGGGATQTLNTAAGTNLTWTADSGYWNHGIWHQGPLAAYMAKVPAGQTAASWDGSGAVWFKIYQEMPDFSGSTPTWPSYMTKSRSVQIPSCIENGEYLFRLEHLALHQATIPGYYQFYIGCAQIDVTGGSGAKKPQNLVAFPGAYKQTDPGLVFDVYSTTIKSYTPVGPAVFTC